MIRVSNLVKTYKKRRSKKRITAVDNISFEIREREIFALLGPNGAGKTTTIKSICGLIVPDKGEIEIKGHSVLKERSRALRNISVVLEGSRNLYWRMTPVENIMYFCGIRGKTVKKSAALEILRELGIENKANQVVHSLSRGMQQKAAIAVCLAAETDVLLLDEPTLGLDVNSSVEFRRIIKELSNRGKTILLSTHDMNLVEAVADRVAIMNKAKIVVCEEKERLVNLFTARGYKFRVKSNGNGETEKLKSLNPTSWKKDGDVIEFHLNLTSSGNLYQVIETLKGLQLEIDTIEREMVNFEKIFIEYTSS